MAYFSTFYQNRSYLSDITYKIQWDFGIIEKLTLKTNNYLSVLAYYVSVMMRQKKGKFRKQEQRSFIDWVISDPVMITRIGHRTELKMYEHHFKIKLIGKSLTGSSKQYKNRERR
jgi:hypothetical protein